MRKRLQDFDLYEQYKKWSNISGDFRCFFRATNFVSLKHYPDFELEAPGEKSIYEEAVLKIIDLHSDKETLYILELPGVEAIQCACILNKKRRLIPVLTFNSILHPQGLVGGKKYISNLLQCADQIQTKEVNSWLFVMDGERFRECAEDELRNGFNNQYEITEEDLPAVEMLREMKIQQLVYMYEREIMSDLAAYMEYLKVNNITLNLEEIII